MRIADFEQTSERRDSVQRLVKIPNATRQQFFKKLKIKNQKSKIKHQHNESCMTPLFLARVAGHIVNVKNSKLVSLQPTAGFKRDDRIFQRGEGAIVTLLESTKALTTRDRHQIKSNQKQFRMKCCAVTQT
jgi:hypothetical protein